MDWATNLHQFQDLVLSSSWESPYFLLLVGLLISLTSGVAFAATLKQRMQDWSKNLPPQTLSEKERLQFLIPFFSTAAGFCIFLASGLEIFGLPTLLSYAVSVLLTVLISSLVGARIGKNIDQRILGSS